MPSLFQVLTTYVPVTAVIVAGIVLAAFRLRRAPVAALLAIAGGLAWLGQGVLTIVEAKHTGTLTSLLEDAVFAAGVALLLSSALVGLRRRRERTDRR